MARMRLVAIEITNVITSKGYTDKHVPKIPDNLAAGLMAYWKPDDGSEPTAKDSSRSGNHESLQGFPPPVWDGETYLLLPFKAGRSR